MPGEPRKMSQKYFVLTCVDFFCLFVFLSEKTVGLDYYFCQWYHMSTWSTGEKKSRSTPRLTGPLCYVGTQVELLFFFFLMKVHPDKCQILCVRKSRKGFVQEYQLHGYVPLKLIGKVFQGHSNIRRILRYSHKQCHYYSQQNSWTALKKPENESTSDKEWAI